jgi:hypothetical protein
MTTTPWYAEHWPDGSFPDIQQRAKKLQYHPLTGPHMPRPATRQKTAAQNAIRLLETAIQELKLIAKLSTEQHGSTGRTDKSVQKSRRRKLQSARR